MMRKAIVLLCCLLSLPDNSWAAISAAMVWEVRSTGSDSNGGAFKLGASGTDYSKQDSPQATGTASNSTSTTVTATTGIFTSAMVGNAITDGTTWAEITGFTDSTHVTVAYTGATPTWTAVSVKVGGAVATPAKAIAQMASSNTVWIKASATYGITATLTPPAGANDAPSQVIGYTTARGDGGQATIQISSGSFIIFTISNANNWLKNLILDCNNAGSNARCLQQTGGSGLLLENIKATKFADYGLVINGGGNNMLSRCWVTANGTGTPAYGYYLAQGGTPLIDCVASGLSCPGFAIVVGNSSFTRCIAANNTGASSDGFYYSTAGSHSLVNCIAYKNARSGVRLDAAGVSNTFLMRNTILVTNSAYGIDNNTGTTSLSSEACADYNFVYNNTTAARHNFPTGAHDVTLTGDPFTNGTSNDFSLISTAGGLQCRAAGFPGLMPNGTSTGYTDGGAIQHQDAGGIKVNPPLSQRTRRFQDLLTYSLGLAP